MKRPPLLIISCSRSGSSMIAGIFAKHGFWVGTQRKPDKHNEKGYYENLKVKKFMQICFKDNIKEANKGKIYSIKQENADVFKNKFDLLIARDGYKNDLTPWLVKFGANYWLPVKRIYPACTTLCLFRDKDAVLKSGKKSFKVTEKRVDASHKLMNQALQCCKSNTYRVDFEEITTGNYSQLMPVFRREQVEPDIDLIDKFVDPKLVHFKGDK